MFSDSSSDSESGIRFKTTTTRQANDKSVSRIKSPIRLRRFDSSYDRDRDGRSRNFSQHRSNIERKSDRYDRKLSPKNYHKNDSSKPERSRDYDRNKDRERDRKTSRRHRSPSDVKHSKTYIDKKHARTEKSESHNGNTSIMDSKSAKSDNDTKNYVLDDDKKGSGIIENLKNKRENRCDKKLEHIKNESDRNLEKAKSGNKNTNSLIYDSQRSSNSIIEKNGKTNIKNTETINNDTEKDNEKNIKNTAIIKRLDSESLEYDDRKSFDDTKQKSKKAKRVKHSKKHKKKKIDLSEGELTPSDNDTSVNNTDIGKTYFSDERNFSTQDSSPRSLIGPEIPLEFKKNMDMEDQNTIEISDSGHISSEDDTYGPLPSTCSKLTKAHYELEKRALQIRMDKINEENATDEKIRDEWMIELPDSKARHLGLGPRKFRAREGPDMSDRSMWTETPQSKIKSKSETEISLSNKIADEAHRLRIKEKDILQEKIIKKLKKKHKREESLLDMHQKKLRRKKKKEKEAGITTERRRFDRDIDLGVNKFDEAQKKSILKKAQLLDTRFSQGESKFL